MNMSCRLLCFFFFLVFCIPIYAASASIEAQLTQLENKIKVPLTLAEEKQYGTLLHRLLKQALAEKNEKATVIIFTVAQKMRAFIKDQFKTVTTAEYDQAHHSVGIALFQKNAHPNQVIAVLIREGNLLSGSAEALLALLYEYPTQHYPRYDSRILNFFKILSHDGVPRGQLEYGKILLNGIGVKQDVQKGMQLIAASGIAEGYLLLATYYIDKDSSQFEHYLRLAAAQENPQALYNLGILEQKKHHYKESVALFSKTLALDPTYYAAELELGRMYIEGWGVARDMQKGLKMLQDVLDHTADEMLKTLAEKNIQLIKKYQSTQLRHFDK